MGRRRQKDDGGEPVKMCVCISVCLCMLYLRGDISDIHMFLQRIQLIQKSNEELRVANEAFKKITVSTSVWVF